MYTLLQSESEQLQKANFLANEWGYSNKSIEKYCNCSEVGFPCLFHAILLADIKMNEQLRYARK